MQETAEASEFEEEDGMGFCPICLAHFSGGRAGTKAWLVILAGEEEEGWGGGMGSAAASLNLHEPEVVDWEEWEPPLPHALEMAVIHGCAGEEWQLACQ